MFSVHAISTNMPWSCHLYTYALEIMLSPPIFVPKHSFHATTEIQHRVFTALLALASLSQAEQRPRASNNVWRGTKEKKTRKRHIKNRTRGKADNSDEPPQMLANGRGRLVLGVRRLPLARSVLLVLFPSSLLGVTVRRPRARRPGVSVTERIHNGWAALHSHSSSPPSPLP